MRLVQQVLKEQQAQLVPQVHKEFKVLQVPREQLVLHPQLLAPQDPQVPLLQSRVQLDQREQREQQVLLVVKGLRVPLEPLVQHQPSLVLLVPQALHLRLQDRQVQQEQLLL